MGRNKGFTIPEETRRRMSDASPTKGKPRPAEIVTKIRQGVRNQKRVTCSCGMTVTPGNYARWHGEKCKHELLLQNQRKNNG